MSPTRREVLAAGAGVALAGLLTRSTAQAFERPNFLVIVIDTLRADHVFGDRARTPNIDALARAGLSFTRAIPEGLPTVPVRNAILSGRHSFPFRGWHDYRGLMDSPGWSPLRDPATTWTRALGRSGYSRTSRCGAASTCSCGAAGRSAAVRAASTPTCSSTGSTRPSVNPR
jgi:hypothetical protein